MAKAKPDSLLGALAEVQAKIEAIFHDAKGEVEGRTFDYATLPAVLAVVRPQLTKNGLVLLQPTAIEGEWLVVKTAIHHAATGDSTEATYPVSQAGKSHPDMAAALTMARRSSLLSLLGIFPEGEDTNAGTRTVTATPQAIGGARPSVATPSSFTRGAAKDEIVDRMTKALEGCKSEDDLDAQWEADGPARSKISQNAQYGLSEIRERRRVEIQDAAYLDHTREADPILAVLDKKPEAAAPITFKPDYSGAMAALDACDDAAKLSAWEAEHATVEKLKAYAPGERAALNGRFKAMRSKFTPASESPAQ